MTLQEQLENTRYENVVLRGLDQMLPTMTAFGLRSHVQARIAFLLSKRAEMTKEALHFAIYDDATRSDNLISVHVSKLRVHLKKFGIEIRTLWGVGYAMPPESRARFKQILEGDVA